MLNSSSNSNTNIFGKHQKTYTKRFSSGLKINGRRPLHMFTKPQAQQNEVKESIISDNETDQYVPKKLNLKKLRRKRFNNVSPIGIHKNLVTSNNISCLKSDDAIQANLPDRFDISDSSVNYHKYMKKATVVLEDISPKRIKDDHILEQTPCTSGASSIQEPIEKCSDLEILNVYSLSPVSEFNSSCSSENNDINEKSSKCIISSSSSSSDVESSDFIPVSPPITKSVSAYPSHFISTFQPFCNVLEDNDTSNKDSSPDKDDLIVVSEIDKNFCFSFWDIKRVVKNIVSNVMMENSSAVDDLTAMQVAERMKTLYHQDFTQRLNDIRYCLHGAKVKCKRSSLSLQEVRPGVRYSDLETLNPGEWLNDVVVNEYIRLLVADKPWACYLSSFFYEELMRNVSPVLPEEWFEKKYLLIPICLDSHWSLFCALPQTQQIEVYNSMSITAKEEHCANVVLHYLQCHYNNALNVDEKWSATAVHGISRQQNEYDCGVYVCMYARKILYSLASNFDHTHVSRFREWLKAELIENRLNT